MLIVKAEKQGLITIYPIDYSWVLADLKSEAHRLFSCCTETDDQEIYRKFFARL